MKKTFFLLGVLIYSALSAQTKTNIEMLTDLIDSSAVSIAKRYAKPKTNYILRINTPAEYNDLKSQILNSLIKAGIQIKHDSAECSITYSLLRAQVVYPDLMRDGFFGEYILKRKFILSGEYTILHKDGTYSANKFNYVVTDSIPYDNIDFVENNSIPFSKGKRPDEPFFSGIIEPVIAITTVVVTAILFFSVRSK